VYDIQFDERHSGGQECQVREHYLRIKNEKQVCLHVTTLMIHYIVNDHENSCYQQVCINEHLWNEIIHLHELDQTQQDLDWDIEVNYLMDHIK
jgi:hypothetical protein